MSQLILYVTCVLYFLNRTEELLLYKRLLSNYVVPREKLDKAIILDERCCVFMVDKQNKTNKIDF
jgi:hypothetical protein